MKYFFLAWAFLLTITVSSHSQDINASQGFGKFVEGLPLENTFTVENYPANTEIAIFALYDTLNVAFPDTAIDLDKSNGFSGTLNMKHLDSNRAFLVAFYDIDGKYISETPFYWFDIISKPSWVDSSQAIFNSTENDILSYTVFHPINLNIAETVGGDLIGMAGKAFEVSNAHLGFTFVFDKSTGVGTSDESAILFELNTLGLHKEWNEIPLGNTLLLQEDLNFYLTANATYQTDEYSFSIPGINLPVAPLTTISFNAGINFYASLEGKIVFGYQDGSWGFIEAGLDRTSVVVQAFGNGYVRGDVKVLGGMLSADASLALNTRLGLGLYYQNIPYESAEYQFGGDYSLTGEVNIKAFSFWGFSGVGLYTYGPKQFWYDGFGTYPGTLEPIYDSTNTESVINTYKINESFVLPNYSPEPVFDSYGDFSGSVWVDNTGDISTLFFSLLDPNTNAFTEPLAITENTNGINNPSLAFTPDGSAFITYSQNRYDLNALPSNVTLQDLLEAQDIYLAFYDAVSGSIVYNEHLEDDMSSLQSGRAESNAQVATNGQGFTIITWLVQDDPQALTNSIWYSTLELDNNTWYLSIPKKIDGTFGANKELNLVFDQENGEPALAWINDPDADETTKNNQVLFSTYSLVDNEWNGLSVMNNFEARENLSYEELSLDANAEYLAISVTTTIETDSSDLSGLFIGIYDSNIDDWNFFEAVDSTVYNYYKPVVSINSNNIASICFQKVQPIIDAQHVDQGNIELYLKNLSNTDPWINISNSPLVSDSSSFVWEMDASFGKNDNLYILTQETDSIAGNENDTPNNGIIFGVPELNMVLRGLEVDEALNTSPIFLPDGTITNIHKNELASAKRLFRNVFPNPVIETSTIEYRIEKPAQVSIELYDLLGNKIKDVFSNYLTPGTYQTEFNKGNLASGVYLLKISADELQQSIRLVVY